MDATTHAREFGQSVVMLDVKKRGGKNLIQAAEAIRKIVDNARSTIIPQDVETLFQTTPLLLPLIKSMT